MNNEDCCSGVAYPPESNLTHICKPHPRDLTDTEKAIYLKLVGLAKAGKITWEWPHYGKCGEYRINLSEQSVILEWSADGSVTKEIAYFTVSGVQISDDLHKIAKAQWTEWQAVKTAEFLQA